MHNCHPEFAFYCSFLRNFLYYQLTSRICTEPVDVGVSLVGTHATRPIQPVGVGFKPTPTVRGPDGGGAPGWMRLAG